MMSQQTLFTSFNDKPQLCWFQRWCLFLFNVQIHLQGFGYQIASDLVWCFGLFGDLFVIEFTGEGKS